MGAPSQKKCAQRNRIKYRPEQLECLEKEFARSHYPDTVTMDELADKLDVSMDRISIWFQNRRSKFKRQSKGSHVTWMRNQIYDQGASSSSDPSSGPQRHPKFILQRHVLSAPAPTFPRRDMAWQAPSSNLHYLPTTPTIMDQLVDIRQSSPTSSNSCSSSPEASLYVCTQPTAPGSPPLPTSPLVMPPVSPRTAVVLSHLYDGQQTIPSSSSYQPCPGQPPSCLFANHYGTMPMYATSSAPFSNMSLSQLPGV